MLVPFIYAIPGKMLDRSRHPLLLGSLDISSTHDFHPLRITAKGSGIRNRIAEIIIHVHHRSKGIVGTHALAFPGTDSA
ncbi:hypothetical protein D3C77_624510 [compost metagenome]